VERNQEFAPHMDWFLRDIIDAVSPVRERLGRQQRPLKIFSACSGNVSEGYCMQARL